MLSKFQDQKSATIRSFLNFSRGQEIPQFPLTTFLEVSNVCNLKCAMCTTFSALNPRRIDYVKSRKRGFMKFDEKFMQSIETVLPHTLNVHCFGYGEPTVHSDFSELISRVGSYEVLLDFFTNGMRLDADFIERLVANRVFKVTVSFSGTTKEEYENIYIGGVFEKVVEGIRNLAKLKKERNSKYPIIAVNSIAFRHHVKTLDRFVEFMAEIGVNQIELKPLEEYEHITTLHGHASDFKSVENRIVLDSAVEKAERLGVVLWVHPTLYSADGPARGAATPAVAVRDMKKVAEKTDTGGTFYGKVESVPVVGNDMNAHFAQSILQIEEPAREDFVCPEPFQTLFLSQSGGARPCCFWPDHAPALGSSKGSTALDIWRGQGFKLIREGAMTGKYSKPGCSSCIRRSLAPLDDFPWYALREYLSWHTHCFENSKLQTLKAAVRDANGCRAAAKLYVESHGTQTKHSSSEMTEEAILDFATNLPSTLGYPDFFEGQIDTVEKNLLWGWIWSPKGPSFRLPLTVTYQGEAIAKAEAANFRDDLKRAGKGDGFYGFAVDLNAFDIKNFDLLEVKIGDTNCKVPKGHLFKQSEEAL